MRGDHALKITGSYPLSVDHTPAQTRREVVMGNFRLLGVAMGSKQSGAAGAEFVWRHGKDMVTVSRAGKSWQVAFLTQGRLLGPRTVVYQGLHRQAKFAAWDVMARVINASHDEDEGMSAAMDAAHWMRRQEASGRSPSDA
jgi:hypothetical protein